jgi:hypothetical protein
VIDAIDGNNVSRIPFNARQRDDADDRRRVFDRGPVRRIVEREKQSNDQSRRGQADNRDQAQEAKIVRWNIANL